MRLGFVLAACVALAVSARPSLGVVVTIDEDGNGTLDGKPNPGVPGTNGGVVYRLPAGVFPNLDGVVLLFEPGVTPQAASDAVHIQTGPNGGTLTFYSDTEGADKQLADTGIPTFDPHIIISPSPEFEISPGVFGTLIDEHDAAGNIVNQLTVISDVENVPEPASLIAWSLLGLCALGFGRRNLRRAA